MKKYFKVGFTYYPHESLGGSEYIVYGSEEQAKFFLDTKIAELPEWVQDQVKVPSGRTGWYINEADVKIL